MSAVRILLIFFVLGGLALFALQNMSPAVPLVILGGTTLALPLAIWVGGAIAAGAITTLVIFGLAGLGRSAPRRAAANRPTANRFGSGFRMPAGSSRPAAGGATRIQDDWTTDGQAQDEWDNWEDAQEPARSTRSPQSEIRDRMDEDWANWEGYESRRNDRRTMPVDRPPLQTDFEVKQEPATRYQSGSIYSYSYNKPEEASRQPQESYDSSYDASEDALPRRPGGVYDADYRVITPPYRTEPEDISPNVANDEDWDLEDLTDEDFKPDDSSGSHERDRRL